MMLVTGLPIDHHVQRGVTLLKYTCLPNGRSFLSVVALKYPTLADTRTNWHQDLEITGPYIQSTLQHETVWLYHTLCPIRMHRRRSEECRPEIACSTLCHCDQPSCNGRQPSLNRRYHEASRHHSASCVWHAEFWNVFVMKVASPPIQSNVIC